MIYVTHDQVEAMTLADKIVVLRDGRVEQVGSPRELYERPDNIFVAQFIGSPKMNILPASAAGGFGAQPDGTVHVGIRPEHLSLVAPEEGHIVGKVVIAEYTGAATLLHVTLAGGETCLVVVDVEAPEPDAQVGLTAHPKNLHYFDADGLAFGLSRT